MIEIICKSCGSIDEYRTEKKANNLVAYCTSCGKYIKNIPYSIPTLHFGKYKGTKIVDFTTPEMMNYLHWVINNDVKVSVHTKQAIYDHLGLDYE